MTDQALVELTNLIDDLIVIAYSSLRDPRSDANVQQTRAEILALLRAALDADDDADADGSEHG